MLNLYVKELREPNYSTDIRNKPTTERVYNRSYLPNGQQVEIKCFKDQQKGVNKLYIEDWKRISVDYPTEFQGETHHLVRDKNDHHFYIQSNFRGKVTPTKNDQQKVLKFEK